MMMGVAGTFWWLFISMHTYGGLAAPLAALAVLGLAGGAHQAWSASVYTLGSDMFPKSDVASITGLSGMAGQIGSVLFQTAVGFTLSHFVTFVTKFLMQLFFDSRLLRNNVNSHQQSIDNRITGNKYLLCIDVFL